MELLIIPERAHKIHQNEVKLDLVEGVEVPVPERFLDTLIAEGVVGKKQLAELRKAQAKANKKQLPVGDQTNADGQEQEQ